MKADLGLWFNARQGTPQSCSPPNLRERGKIKVASKDAWNMEFQF